MKSHILHDEAITLRALDATDLEDMLRWENDTRLWDVGLSIAPYSKGQIWEYLQNYDGDIYRTKQLRLIIEESITHKSIGAIDICDFDPFNRRAAIGILIDTEYQRKGYGSRAVCLLKEYLITFLGLHQCYAYIPVGNIASINLFTKAGFTHTCTLKQWNRYGNEYSDVAIMQFIFTE